MNISSRFLTGVGAVVMTTGAVLFAQGGDAAKVLADMRQALGGDKLAAVKTLTATGKNDRAAGEKSISSDYEMAVELPDRYLTKQLLAQTPLGNVSLTSGFNGSSLIQDTEMPQSPGGGAVRMFTNGGPGPNASPEEKKAADLKMIAAEKEEFARMALGMFGNSTPAFPLEFSYGGVAESGDGKADIIIVKGEGDFAGKLFVDQKTHLPLMYSWMAKEPVGTVSTSTTSASRGGGGGSQVTTFGGGAANGGGTMRAGTMSPEERDKMMKDMQDRMKEAEAKRKVVEFRVYYGNYQNVDGVKLPHSFQQSVAGNAASEITIEKYKVNPKIDPKRFEPKK